MSTKRVPIWYFHKEIWPNYIECNKSILSLVDIILNGEEDKETLLQKTLQFLNGEKVEDCREIFQKLLEDSSMEGVVESVIWITTHCHTDNSAENNNPLDLPLSKLGIDQAHELARYVERD